MRQFFWTLNSFWTVLLFTLISISICMSQTFLLGVKRINFIFPSQMQKGKWKPFYFFKARKRSEWSREIFILRSRLLPHFFHNCITLSKQTSVSKIFHPNWFKSQKTQYVKCCVKMHPTYFNSSYCIIERKVAFPLKYRKKMCCQKWKKAYGFSCMFRTNIKRLDDFHGKMQTRNCRNPSANLLSNNVWTK